MVFDGNCCVAFKGQNHLGARPGCGLCQARNAKPGAACVTGILWAHGPEISSTRRSVQAQILLGFLPDFHGEFGCAAFSFHIDDHENPGTKNVYHSKIGKPTSLSVRKGCSRTSKGPVSLQLGTFAGKILQIRTQTKHVSSIDQTWNGFQICRMEKEYKAGDQVEQIRLRMVPGYGPWHIFPLCNKYWHESNQDTSNNEEYGSS